MIDISILISLSFAIPYLSPFLCKCTLASFGCLLLSALSFYRSCYKKVIELFNRSFIVPHTICERQKNLFPFFSFSFMLIVTDQCNLDSFVLNLSCFVIRNLPAIFDVHIWIWPVSVWFLTWFFLATWISYFYVTWAFSCKCYCFCFLFFVFGGFF